MDSDDIVEAHTPKHVALQSCENSLWLVKVPKYLAEEWSSTNRNPSCPVAVLKMAEKGVILESTLASSTIPKRHQFCLTKIPEKEQKMYVVSQKTSVNDKSISIEGFIGRKAECRPILDKSYLEAKKKRMMQTSSSSSRQQNNSNLSTSLSKTVELPLGYKKAPEFNLRGSESAAPLHKPAGSGSGQTTKIHEGVLPRNPVTTTVTINNDGESSTSSYTASFKRDPPKKEAKERCSKDELQRMVLGAFETHEFYLMKDLQMITGQSANFLKEILNEYCQCSNKPPHKGMWQLKDEYRHYSKVDDSD